MAGMKQPPNGPPNGPHDNQKPSNDNRPGCLSIAAWFGGLAALAGINRAVSHRDRGDTSPDDAVQAQEANATLPAESIAEGHEVRGLRLRPFLMVATGFAIGGVVVLAGLWLLLQTWTGRDLTFDPQVPPAIVQETDAPGPDLVPVPRLEYQRYRAQEIELLHSYGQSEGQTDTARIPIERAMQILAEQGLPARDGDVPDFGLDDAYQLDSEGGVE